jgi:hypothetical protein
MIMIFNIKIAVGEFAGKDKCPTATRKEISNTIN